MDTLFIYNAEAEVDVKLDFRALTSDMKQHNRRSLNAQFDELMRSTFKLRSDNVPSDAYGHAKTIEDCTAPANLMAYALANYDANKQGLDGRVFWGQGAQKALKDIYDNNKPETAHNASDKPGNVVVISIGIVPYEPDIELGIGNADYRFITVDTTEGRWQSYQRYRAIGHKASKKALDSIKTLFETPSAN